MICCYPDMEGLVRHSAARARMLYGLVYPRDTRLVRLGVATVNLVLRLLRKPLRAFVHPAGELEPLLEASGFASRYAADAGVWRVAVHRRIASPSPS